MTFYDFVIKKYYGKDTPNGDFAYDAEREKNSFPMVQDSGKESRQIVKEYLIRRNACSECLKAFSNCWTAYRRYSEKQKSTT